MQVFAYRDLDATEYKEWLAEYEEASRAIGQRKQKQEVCLERFVNPFRTRLFCCEGRPEANRVQAHADWCKCYRGCTAGCGFESTPLLVFGRVVSAHSDHVCFAGWGCRNPAQSGEGGCQGLDAHWRQEADRSEHRESLRAAAVLS